MMLLARFCFAPLVVVAALQSGSVLAAGRSAVDFAVPSSSALSSGSSAIQWNPGAATVAGTGCYAGVDTAITVNGNDVSVVFTNLGVDLADGGPLQASRTCQIEVPATSDGQSFASIFQTLSYGVNKSAGASASLRANGNFFGVALPMPSVTLGAGALNQAGLTATSELDAASTRAAMCHHGNSGGLSARFNILGQRNSSGERITAFEGNGDLRWDVTTTWKPCP